MLRGSTGALDAGSTANANTGSDPRAPNSLPLPNNSRAKATRSRTTACGGSLGPVCPEPQTDIGYGWLGVSDPD
jgi:hypothetical protein